MHFVRSIAAVLAAFALVLSVAGGAFAASASSDVPETLVVNEACVLTGAPSSIDYGAGAADSDRLSGAFDLHASCNSQLGLTLASSATALTDGSFTIPAAAHNQSVDAGAYGPLGTIGTRSTPGAIDANVQIRVHVPADAAAGSYTGTLTLSATSN